MKPSNTRAPRAGLAGALALLLPIFASVAHAQPVNSTPGGAVLDSVLVAGNVRQLVTVITAQAGLTPGTTITYRDVSEAVRRLMASGFYEDVRVFSRFANDADQGPVVLTLDVTERPFLTDIQFEGLEHIRASTIRDSAQLVMRSPMQPSNVAAAEHLIREMLGQRGFMVRNVSHRLEAEPQPGEYRLVFDVDIGQRVTVADIEFQGNEAFTASELWSAMGTKPEGFLWFRSGLYDEDKVRADLRERLPDFYASAGYIDFTVLGDSLVVDPISGKARLIIKVDEGPQYQLADFSINGNRQFPESELRQYFERDRGGILAGLGIGGRAGSSGFDRGAFDEATAQVSQLYRNRGYLYARVNPVIERTALEDGTPAVNVSWQIEEGPPAYVNRVSIVGNTKTHEKVIRDRIFILPGDVYSEELLIQSYQSIMGLGFFEAPLPLPRIEPNESGDVDITFEVTEKQTGSINFGTSIGGGGGLSGFLGYDEPNLFGQAKSGSMRWEFGRWNNNFEASYSDPSIRGSRVSGSLSLFRARDRFVQFPEGQRRRTGASIRFGLPLPVSDFRTRLVMGYTLARTEYEQFSEDESSVFGQAPGVQSTVSLGIVRNTLNSPIFPTQGVSHEISAAFTGGPLGGDGTFQKYTASGSWWVPVGQRGGNTPGSMPIRFALGLTAEAGVIVGNEASLRRFPFERFWMGGIQFGRPLRGYDETTITPSGFIPQGAAGVSMADRHGDAYLRLSAEYAVRFADNISVSVFYDAGGLWNKPSQINPTRLHRGAGIGAMLVTPLGPIGIDYAYGFDKDRPGWQLHFKFGQGF